MPRDHIVLSLAVATVLAACANGIPVQTYSGARLPLSQVAVVKARTDQAELQARFMSYVEGTVLVAPTQLGSALTGYPSEVQLKAGTYTLGVECAGSRGKAMPSLVVTVAAGFTYEVSCARSGTDLGMVRARVSKTTESENRQ